VKQFNQLPVDRGAPHFGTDPDIAFAPQLLPDLIYGNALAGLGQLESAIDHR